MKHDTFSSASSIAVVNMTELDEAESDERETKRLKQSYIDHTEIRTVLVGAEQKAFMVHVGYVTAVSEWFAAVCSRRWTDNDTAIMLPEADEKTFQAYLQWVYTGQIVYWDGSEDANLISTRSHSTQIFGAIFELYILGEFLQDESCRNAVIDMYLDVSDELGLLPEGPEMQMVLKRTSDTCRMRKLLCLQFVHEMEDLDGLLARTLTDTQDIKFSAEVASEAVLCFRKGGKEVWLGEKKCRFHEHWTTPKGRSCKKRVAS